MEQEEPKKAKNTTVSIPIETAAQIDKYIEMNPQFKAYGRSGVIAAAIEYLNRTGADIMGDYTMNGKTADSIEDLKESLSRIEAGNKSNQEQMMKMFFSFLSSQKMLCDSGGLLPSVVDTALAVEQRVKAENELEEVKEALNAARKEISRVKREFLKLVKSIDTEI